MAVGYTPGDTAGFAAEPDWHVAFAPRRQSNTQALVSAAYAFPYTLDRTQLSQTLLPFTPSYAVNRSNLPGVARNGPAMEASASAYCPASNSRRAEPVTLSR